MRSVSQSNYSTTKYGNPYFSTLEASTRKSIQAEVEDQLVDIYFSNP